MPEELFWSLFALLALVSAAGLGLAFKRLQRVEPGLTPANAPPLEPLERELRKITEQLGGIEKRMKEVELEWANAYGSLRKIAGRIDRSKQQAQQQDAEELPQEPPTAHDLAVTRNRQRLGI